MPVVSEAEIQAAIDRAIAPFDPSRDENPFSIQDDLQTIMNDLVGIIRTGDEMRAALEKIEALKERMSRVHAMGGRGYNPGWHLALDLPKQVLVSESVARAALAREESRGGHTRNDFPVMSPDWRQVNLICRVSNGQIDVTKQPVPTIPLELIQLFDVAELKKYMTIEELTSVGMA